MNLFDGGTVASAKRNPVAIVILVGVALLLLGLVAAASWYLADTKVWPWIPGVLVVLGMFVFRDVVRRSGEDRMFYSILLGILVLLFLLWFAAGARRFYQAKEAGRSGNSRRFFHARGPGSLSRS